MKKILFVLIIMSVFIISAQEEEIKPAEETAKPEYVIPQNVEEVKTEELKKEEEPQKETVTMSKEEIEQLVKKMVAEELAKKDAEKKKEEPEKKEESAEKPNKLNERDGLIAPNYSKSSVTFVMGDENLRDNSQYSPKWDIGNRYEYESFAQRIYGYSNIAKSSSQFTLFHEEEGFIKNLTARISLSFAMYNSMMPSNRNVSTSFAENKTFLEIDYRHPSTNRFKLTFYPYNAESIAIGNFRGLRWGSNRMVWPQQQSGQTAVPGFQALYGYGDISVYFGFKANAQQETDVLAGELAPMETTYGFFGGVSYSNKDLGLKGHLQGAFIDKGDNVNIEEAILADPDDDKILSYGFDAFAEYNYGSQLGDPIGINSFLDGSWLKPDYTSKFAFRVKGEYLFQNQRLQNADYMSIQNVGNIEPITDNFFAHGAAFELGGRFKGIRAMFMYSYRDLPFMVFDAPGVVPYQTISSQADQSPEHLFTISADYHIWDLWFGISYGYKIPATYTVYDANGQKNVTVIKERISSDAVSTAFDRSREVLPAGRDPLDMMFIKLNVKYGFSDTVTAMLEYSFTQDHNRQKMVATEDGPYVGEFDVIEVMDIHGLFFLVEGRF
ncbi:MAG TPA: hypothetical protein PLW37_11335 [bacterium]|jgi:hypothetical protein|nr:hypothetical protein [bacterium]MDX9805650.1 hypothetical protein [bacterium]HOG44504.1 hypothetical protein [bacterium]HPV20951.1 hypothetical protein [bacterium]HQB10451.1 hypothetical protein [bacterium]